MAEIKQTWNLTETEWARLTDTASSQNDILADGAYVRFEAETGDLLFYATAFNKPELWHYPFAEDITGVRTPGAFVGHGWHQPDTGFVHFEVIVYAAAQALKADYESDVSDMDYVTYEQAVEQAVRGNEQDMEWLLREFAQLEQLSQG